MDDMPDTITATIRNKACIDTAYGASCFYTFKNLSDDKEHLALVFKDANMFTEPIVRIHSECMTGDVFSSAKCDCGEQLNEAMQIFANYGGIILYLRQEGRGIGLYNKIDAYALQNKGYDTYEANQQLHFSDDLRDYKVAAEMLKALGINQVRLVTNNPEKMVSLQASGISVNERISTGVYIKKQNIQYINAKQTKTNHLFSNRDNILTYFKEGSINHD